MIFLFLTGGIRWCFFEFLGGVGLGGMGAQKCDVKSSHLYPPLFYTSVFHLCFQPGTFLSAMPCPIDEPCEGSVGTEWPLAEKGFWENMGPRDLIDGGESSNYSVAWGPELEMFGSYARRLAMGNPSDHVTESTRVQRCFLF